MVPDTLAQPDQPDLRAIAPAWHTAVLLLVTLGLSALSARSQGLPSIGRGLGHIGGYVFGIAVEWSLTIFVWLGIRGQGVGVGDLIGGSWRSLRAVLSDLGLAVSFLIVSNIVLAILAHLLRATPNHGIRSIFPNGRTEVVLYLLLAVAAGFCEEIIFRGYLQRQFAALTKSNAGGLILQSVAFGVAHGYQGAKYMFIIGVFGCLFGLLAYWRKTLRPGMTAHFLQDALIGLTRHLPK